MTKCVTDLRQIYSPTNLSACRDSWFHCAADYEATLLQKCNNNNNNNENIKKGHLTCIVLVFLEFSNVGVSLELQAIK